MFRILVVPNSFICLTSTKKTHTSGTVALEITLLYPDIPILFMLSLNAQPLLDTSSLETNRVSEFHSGELYMKLFVPFEEGAVIAEVPKV